MEKGIAMPTNVRVLFRRPRTRQSRHRATEMVIVRHRRVIAVLRDDDPAGRYLLRLFQLPLDQLRDAWQLGSPDVWAQPFVREVVDAFIDFKAGDSASEPGPGHPCVGVG